MEENLTQTTTKNAGWNFATSIVSKISSLIFTIVLARMLLPELFGAYNLVLSVVIIATMFTDLGVGNAAMRYISEAIGKRDNKKARSYFGYFLRIKSILVLLTILIVLILSKFLSYTIFEKPIIFVPLLVSTLYLLATSIRSFINMLLISKRDLSKIFVLESVFEASKIVFVVLAIYLLSRNFVVSGIFLALALATFASILFSFIFLKNYKSLIFGRKERVEKDRIWTYISSMSLVSLTLVFFGSIDVLMLGRFVDTEFIGYYRAALGLVVTVSSLFGFPNVLLPVFTQIHREKFERAFEKVARYLIILTVPAFIGLAIIAKYFILAIYGSEYILATNSLYALSAIILIAPFIVLYSSIFQAKEKTNILARAVLYSLAINIFLNYLSIKSLLTIGPEYVIVGVGASTLISRIFYIIVLSNKSAHLFKTKLPWRTILKSILAAVVMAVFLVWFNSVIDMNIYLGILEILVGAGIYFGVMFLIGGIERGDLKLLRGLIRR
jgi:O-antigen/teichoic acid export membrane protein